jgi:hypothetical protein
MRVNIENLSVFQAFRLFYLYFFLLEFEIMPFVWCVFKNFGAIEQIWEEQKYEWNQDRVRAGQQIITNCDHKPSWNDWDKVLIL